MVKFQGELDEAIHGWKHGTPFAEMLGLGKARTAKSLRYSRYREDSNRVVQIGIFTPVTGYRPYPDPNSAFTPTRPQSLMSFTCSSRDSTLARSSLCQVSL